MIKPFCVRSEDLTGAELNEMLLKCIELGARELEWVDGFLRSEDTCTHQKDSFKYWGVDLEGDTLTCVGIKIYNNNLLTKDEAFNMLGIKAEDNLPTFESIAKWFEVVYPETNNKTRNVQLGVHFEEGAEMLASINLHTPAIQLDEVAYELKTKDDETEVDRKELLDSLCDQIVTAIGVAHNFDLDIIGALAEVNRSNYSKFNHGVPIYDKNGKLAKGESYEPPKLDKFLLPMKQLKSVSLSSGNSVRQETESE